MFKPSKTFVSFIPVDAPNVSPGGIIAPETYKSSNSHDAVEVKAAKRAKVVAVGPGKMVMGHWRDVSVKPGDYIQLSQNAFIQDFTINGQHTYIVDDEFIVGTLEEEDVVSRVEPPKKEEKRIQVLS
jgi:co-chaperonin GroES (HSP10)